MKYCQTL